MNYADVVATISSMCAVYQSGKDIFKTYFTEFRSSPNIEQEAEMLRLAFITYSDGEIEEIVNRVQGCRDRFMEEGSGERRVRCLCSVLTDVKVGNGGDIPDIDSWRDIYDQLGCATR